jgi:predicted MFS family arabinose efflux permease
MVRETLAPLGEREFRLLFVGRLVSFLGSAVAPVALAFAVIDDLDASASALGLVLMAGWVPQVVFILVGGVVADRLPRHLVLVGSNVVSGAAQIFVGVMLLTGAAELWQLAVAQVIRGFASSFFFPASTGLVPQTVPERHLQQANALLRMTTNTAFVVGSASGGLLVAAAGSGWAITFDGITYFASALILLAMRVEGSVRSGSSFLAELREGWSEFRSREWLWVIVLAALVGNMCSTGGVGVLGPIVADRELGGAAAWGAILAVQSGGLLLGGLIALRWRPKRPLLVAQIAVLFWGWLLFALASGLPAAVIAAGALLSGIGLELFGVYWDTALQQHVPRAALSRVSSYDALGSFVAIPIGLSIVGPISDTIGVKETLWGAFALFIIAQGSALLSRDVRTLPHRQMQSEERERRTPELGGLPAEEV